MLSQTLTFTTVSKYYSGKQKKLKYAFMSKLMHLVLARGYIGRSMRNLGNKKVQVWECLKECGAIAHSSVRQEVWCDVMSAVGALKKESSQPSPLMQYSS